LVSENEYRGHIDSITLQTQSNLYKEVTFGTKKNGLSRQVTP